MNVPVLTTERLTMRGFTNDDLDAFYPIISGEDQLKYFPATVPQTRERVQEMIDRIGKHWETKGYGLWAITLRETGELLGRCGIMEIKDTGETEIDFIFGRPYWNKGYATEAGRAAIRYGFEHLPVDFIVGIVHPDNGASQRALSKLGLTRGERTRYFNMDCYRYVIDREGFRREYGKAASH